MFLNQLLALAPFLTTILATPMPDETFPSHATMTPPGPPAPITYTRDCSNLPKTIPDHVFNQTIPPKAGADNFETNKDLPGWINFFWQDGNCLGDDSVVPFSMVPSGIRAEVAYPVTVEVVMLSDHILTASEGSYAWSVDADFDGIVSDVDIGLVSGACHPIPRDVQRMWIQATDKNGKIVSPQNVLLIYNQGPDGLSACQISPNYHL